MISRCATLACIIIKYGLRQDVERCETEGDGKFIIASHTFSFGMGQRDFWIFKIENSGNSARSSGPVALFYYMLAFLTITIVELPFFYSYA